ncbi:MAG: AbrB/MazE/SpoVT family DNA-binding domain-containing protein [Leptolyngbyaceae cyanobacterium SL_5_9]|nr:AbrB/MazE/SpoVT family DNA-binding domain-containing protein [Leptolyngbyaceae cyanobacterium SL_5_9]NJO73771.1 AbrB/MazE/SpoVT family DNA-binding domain-containing protein [Leptolyngbyaceae cyanobacterium RM1_406_9]
METAQVLQQGENQVVVLSKNFQVEGNEVYVRKIGSTIVLIAKENPWGSLFDSLSEFSEDFMEAREQPVLDSR